MLFVISLSVSVQMLYDSGAVGFCGKHWMQRANFASYLYSDFIQTCSFILFDIIDSVLIDPGDTKYLRALEGPRVDRYVDQGVKTDSYHFRKPLHFKTYDPFWKM